MPAPKSSAAINTLIRALACGFTVENAARKGDVDERTVYRCLKDPAFRAQVEAARAEFVERTAGLFTGAGPTSVKTWIELQQDAATPAPVRRGAARDVLEMGIRYREIANLETRIATLE